jgi:hypothetical protein
MGVDVSLLLLLAVCGSGLIPVPRVDIFVVLFMHLYVSISLSCGYFIPYMYRGSATMLQGIMLRRLIYFTSVVFTYNYAFFGFIVASGVCIEASLSVVTVAHVLSNLNQVLLAVGSNNAFHVHLLPDFVRLRKLAIVLYITLPIVVVFLTTRSGIDSTCAVDSHVSGYMLVVYACALSGVGVIVISLASSLACMVTPSSVTKKIVKFDDSKEINDQCTLSSPYACFVNDD